jgi:hypothetical protein
VKKVPVLHVFGAMWEKDRGFTIILVVLVVHIFVVIPYAQDFRYGRIAYSAFFLLLLSSGLLTLLGDKSTFVLSILVLAICAFGLSILILKGTWLDIVLDLFHLVYCVALAGIILARTFADGEMSDRRIYGAIAGYLLVGLIFSLIYHTIYLLGGQTTFNGMKPYGRSEFMYLSLTTLTTTGYGDITPVATSARSMANMEGLIGQLYPAILIARLVSLQIMAANEK